MDGFFWYVPILLLSMIIGLALDYDVLLISRIMEHRENGYDVKAAICKATCETGGTISAAGIIMTLCFGGMIFSDQLTINVCGFILVEAIILDTFVVQTLLVPALISIGDKVAWWPVQMPHENLKTLQSDEFPQGQ
jgi:RND superfamily putative drug exporter